ncbi:MAG TPA: MerR family transcriptional regulator [Bacteroidales bacterium]|nr:MerR family transcriptional regulator [Bacteroidales bacterium]
MFQVKTSFIRYWEEEFKQIKPKKANNGDRLFTQKDIDYFHIIFHLVKEKGMTLQGAKNYINSKEEEDFEKLEMISTLKKTKAFLQGIKDAIEKKNNKG